MSDQAWAVLIGFLTIVTLRIIDFYLPKGRISKWAYEHSIREEEDEDDHHQNDGHTSSGRSWDDVKKDSNDE